MIHMTKNIFFFFNNINKHLMGFWGFGVLARLDGACCSGGTQSLRGAGGSMKL